MERLALQVLVQLGIEVRVGAETRATVRMEGDLAERFAARIDKELAYLMADNLINKLKRSKTPETVIFKNVPEYKGVNIHRAEAIVFHPDEFDRFLKEYVKAVLLNDRYDKAGFKSIDDF